MSLTTLPFYIFIAILILVYFLVPRKWQPYILLAASLLFYSLTGLKNLIYIFVTALTTYGSALWIRNIKTAGLAVEFASKEEKKAAKKRISKQQKLILIITMVLNFGFLCYFKYLNFIIEQLNHILSPGNAIATLQLIVPLGISFYTFQAMGYLADVYWEKANPERNPFKMLLFVSFFPQITQGPISNYNQLSVELSTEHSFSYRNFSWGTQRFIWGLLKKLVLADTIGMWLKEIFVQFPNYGALTVLIGAFCYSIQIYADFSGYMDMMCGICEIMGIALAENFERPYFSKSVAEYWRRWHITLGAWFKDYIYYPMAFSRFSQKLGKKLRKVFGAGIGKNVPATIALIVVWLATGLWHGANWRYIIWGLLNGVFIILSIWMEPVYTKLNQSLHINERSFGWRAFQVIRTFILVTFIKVFPEVGSSAQGFDFWRHIFIWNHQAFSYDGLFPFTLKNHTDFLIVCTLTLILFIFSIIQRKKPVREYFNRLPIAVRTIILACMFLCTFMFGPSTSGGFLYAIF